MLVKPYYKAQMYTQKQTFYWCQVQSIHYLLALEYCLGRMLQSKIQFKKFQCFVLNPHTAVLHVFSINESTYNVYNSK